TSRQQCCRQVRTDETTAASDQISRHLSPRIRCHSARAESAAKSVMEPLINCEFVNGSRRAVSGLRSIPTEVLEQVQKMAVCTDDCPMIALASVLPKSGLHLSSCNVADGKADTPIGWRSVLIDCRNGSGWSGLLR